MNYWFKILQAFTIWFLLTISSYHSFIFISTLTCQKKKKKKNFSSTLLPKKGGEWPSFELKLVLSIQEISRALCQYENLQLPAVL